MSCLKGILWEIYDQCLFYMPPQLPPPQPSKHYHNHHSTFYNRMPFARDGVVGHSSGKGESMVAKQRTFSSLEPSLCSIPSPRKSLKVLGFLGTFKGKSLKVIKSQAADLLFT